MNQLFTLYGKKALVTGATKGIGLATCQLFLELGAQVIGVARQPFDDEANQTLLQHPHYQFIAADFSNKADIAKVVGFVSEQWLQLDILVNNVGTNIRKKVTDYAPEEIDHLFQTNLLSTVWLTRQLYPLLKVSGNASVVNVASVAGLTHIRSGVVYGMTKAAMSQMTRNLAMEWAADGIRMNAVCPWYIATHLTKGVLGNEQFYQDVIAHTPLQRIGTPKEVAGAIAFFCMPAASYITGQNLAIDGGFMVRGF
ncbi:MAG: SDR family oxidoreductase [Spirosomataceae bacterium]